MLPLSFSRSTFAMDEETSLEAQLNALHDYQRIIRMLPNVVFRCYKDADGKLYPWYNEGALAEEFGVTTLEAVGKTIEQLFPPEFLSSVVPAFERAFAGETVEFASYIGDRVFSNVAKPFATNEQGAVVEIIGYVTDVTARARAEAALKASEERLRVVVTNLPIVLWALDHEGTFTLAEGRGLALLGLTAGTTVGSTIDTVWHSVPQLVADCRRALAGDAFTTLTPLAETILEISYAPIRTDQGTVAGVIAVAVDVTVREQAAAQLQHQALHDSLTHLPNRVLFMDRLAHALSAHVLHQECVAVLFLDLDHFKSINDQLGHGVGDHVLQIAAERIALAVRAGDTPARLGGDEFAVLLPQVASVVVATDIAARIAQSLSLPYHCGEHTVTTTTSIGIALGMPGAAQARDLLRQADAAMYHAKQTGKARWSVFDAHGLVSAAPQHA